MEKLNDNAALPPFCLASGPLWQPIIYSTLSIVGIKDFVLRGYDLDEPLECTFISRSVSDTYKLSTPTARYALKIYRTGWRSTQDILWELSALDHVERRGVNIARPVLRKDGRLITEVRAPEGMRSAVLFQWANGTAPKYTEPEHARQYGQLLARLHEAGEAMPLKCSRPMMDRAYLLDSPLALIRTRLMDRPDISANLDALEARVSARLAEVEQEDLDWGFCHGDVWLNNARFDGDRLVLFDFDFAAKGWRIFDLASYRWDARRRGMEHRAWDPFIDGYMQVRRAVAPSLRFVGLFMLLKHLWTTAFFIERAPETGTNFLSDEELEDLVPSCERIEAEAGGYRGVGDGHAKGAHPVAPKEVAAS